MRTITTKTLAIAALVLAPGLAMAQGAPAGADRDRGGPDAGGHRMEQGNRDRGQMGGGAGQRARGDDGDQRMRGDRGDDRRDRLRGDNDRPGGDRGRVPVGNNDRQDRLRGDDNRRERVRIDGDRRPADRTTIRITSEQKAKVRTRFRDVAGERARGGDFAVDVGRPVPTQYRFSRLPPEIVEVAPEYRDYDYVRVGEQVLIVDPGTREIVDILD